MPYMTKNGTVQLVEQGTVPYWRSQGWLLDSDGDGIPDVGEAQATADAAMRVANTARTTAQATAAALAAMPAPQKGDPGKDGVGIPGAPGKDGTPGAPGSSAQATLIAGGVGKTAALIALGAAGVDVVVTLSRPMPNANYTPELFPVSAGLIAPAATVAVKSKTTTTVTLTITPGTLAVAAGSVVLVLVWGPAGA